MDFLQNVRKESTVQPESSSCLVVLQDGYCGTTRHLRRSQADTIFGENVEALQSSTCLQPVVGRSPHVDKKLPWQIASSDKHVRRNRRKKRRSGADPRQRVGIRVKSPGFVYHLEIKLTDGMQPTTHSSGGLFYGANVHKESVTTTNFAPRR